MKMFKNKMFWNLEKIAYQNSYLEGEVFDQVQFYVVLGKNGDYVTHGWDEIHFKY